MERNPFFADEPLRDRSSIATDRPPVAVKDPLLESISRWHLDDTEVEHAKPRLDLERPLHVIDLGPICHHHEPARR